MPARRTTERALVPAGSAHSVSLRHLASRVEGVLIGDASVTGITEDSRAVRPGWLFCAAPGSRTDGHRHVAEALARGAGAVVAERPLEVPVPLLVVPRVRRAVGPLAAAFYGDPSLAMSVVGITGTNGKTTTSTLLRHCLEEGGVAAGQIGTVGTRYGHHFVVPTLTTPPPEVVQSLLADMADQGVRAVAMEVSSHALDQGRVDGTCFEMAVFTNLSGEHLDYHGTMEHYWASKAMLFEPGRSRLGIIGVDDEWGRRLAAQAAIPVVTFGAHPSATVRVTTEERAMDGIRVTLAGLDEHVRLESRLVGRLNGSNVAAAYLVARFLGLEPEQAAAGVASSPPPPGRFEVVDVGQPFLVVVDYAHTPDALAGLIATARGLTGPGGRVTVVLGARGGRDRFKRPEMGRTAASADQVVLTADSPGNEPVGPIIDQLRIGTCEAPRRAHVVVEPDRRGAIGIAVESARPGDVVLIVGRGHEVVQHVGGRAVSIDDRQVAAEALRARGDAALRRQCG